MATRLPEAMSGFQTQPSSATDPPPRSRWWTQLYSLFLRRNELTTEEKSALDTPNKCGIFTFMFLCVTVTFFMALFSTRPHCDHVTFSVQYISVSPSSSATWRVHFLVKNRSSLCFVYLDGDYVYAKVGSLNAAVLKASHTRSSRGQESFSVDLVTSNQSHVATRGFELDMKLRGKKKQLIFHCENEIGHFDIRCENLMIGHQNVECYSSFKKLTCC